MFPAFYGVAVEIYLIAEGVTFTEAGWNYAQVRVVAANSRFTSKIHTPIRRKPWDVPRMSPDDHRAGFAHPGACDK